MNNGEDMDSLNVYEYPGYHPRVTAYFSNIFPSQNTHPRKLRFEPCFQLLQEPTNVEISVAGIIITKRSYGRQRAQSVLEL